MNVEEYINKIKILEDENMHGHHGHYYNRIVPWWPLMGSYYNIFNEKDNITNTYTPPVVNDVEENYTHDSCSNDNGTFIYGAMVLSLLIFFGLILLVIKFN